MGGHFFGMTPGWLGSARQGAVMRTMSFKTFIGQEWLPRSCSLVLVADSSDTSSENVISTPEDGNASGCSICPLASFVSLADLRNHYKSDWHVENLRRKMDGKSPLTETAFELSGSSPSDASSSSSDSQEDGESGQMGLRKGPFLQFELAARRGQVFLVYRNVILGYEEMRDRRDLDCGYVCDAINRRLVSEAQSRWCIFLMRSGRVAAGIFDNTSDSVIFHKTFKRYTDRCKQGGSQSSKDKEKSRIRSAGAFIRRQNAVLLEADVQNLLESWRSEICGCSLFFWNPTATGRRCLFGDLKRPVLLPSDNRIRSIPFTTGKPTMEELTRSYKALNCIYS